MEECENKTITKEKIALYMKEKIGLPVVICEEIVDATLESILSLVQHKPGVSISNFGKFFIIHKKARPGKNVKTGQAVEVPKRSVLRFAPSRKIKEEI